jgi:hypothetical protein
MTISVISSHKLVLVNNKPKQIREVRKSIKIKRRNLLRNGQLPSNRRTKITLVLLLLQDLKTTVKIILRNRNISQGSSKMEIHNKNNNQLQLHGETIIHQISKVKVMVNSNKNKSLLDLINSSLKETKETVIRLLMPIQLQFSNRILKDKEKIKNNSSSHKEIREKLIHLHHPAMGSSCFDLLFINHTT